MKVPHLERIRKRLESTQAELSKRVAVEFPVGRRCWILWKEGRQRIPGTIVREPSSYYEPTRLIIRSEKRGTIMRADYRDIQLM